LIAVSAGVCGDGGQAASGRAESVHADTAVETAGDRDGVAVHAG
jgi:hypothetical protein